MLKLVYIQLTKDQHVLDACEICALNKRLFRERFRELSLVCFKYTQNGKTASYMSKRFIDVTFEVDLNIKIL